MAPVPTLSDEAIADVYRWDPESEARAREGRPWAKDPHHFRHVHVSSVALLKMSMHARSGGDIEVMGMMVGTVRGDAIVVTDVFSLPVEGTETRVNAASEANEYMVQYLEEWKRTARPEGALGWYHSHPGYGCWLSGIDVETQALYQTHYDPWLAIVVDPTRTAASGKVDIGAFRTYPRDYEPPAAAGAAGAGGSMSVSAQSVPTGKVEDFGVHASRYYPLTVSFFTTPTDRRILEGLEGRYWVQSLTQTGAGDEKRVLHDAGRITDMTARLGNNTSGKAAKLGDGGMAGGRSGGGGGGGGGGHSAAIAGEATKLANERLADTLRAKIRDDVFF
jgi:COP9 signalosome complex subunit 5